MIQKRFIEIQNLRSLFLYRCECSDGLELDSNGRDCEDVDECENNPCPSGSVCLNTLGSYLCIRDSGKSNLCTASVPRPRCI